jgi:hypothetical protein
MGQMKRGCLAVLATSAVLVLGLGVGVAQGDSFVTTITVDDSTATTPITVWGHLGSPSKKCLAGRTVKVFEDFNDGSPKLVGSDRSSQNGVWVAHGDISKLAVGAHVTVARKRVGRPHHRQTCLHGFEPIAF